MHIYPFLETRIENKGLVAANYIGIPLGYGIVFFGLFAVDFLKRHFCCKYEIAAGEHSGWDGFSERTDVDLHALDAAPARESLDDTVGTKAKSEIDGAK